MQKLIIIIFLTYIAQGLDFNINFQQPMTLQSSINFIKTTPNGRIIIHFQNNDWNVYDSLFNLVTTFQILNKTWSNLEIYSDSFGAILDQTKNHVCFFNLTIYSQNTCNTMPGIIGIQPMNLFLNYVAVANSTNFIAFSALGPTSFRNITPLVSFKFANYALGVGTVLNGSVYKMSYTFLNYNYSFLYSHASKIKYLTIVDNYIVFTQDLNNTIKAYNLSSSSELQVASNLYSSLVLITKISSNLMFIYNSEIFYIKYNTTSLQYQKTISITFNVSISNLIIVTTSTASLAYVPSSNVVYSVSQCKGNYIYNGTECVSYACDDINCNSCPISQKVCSECSSSYYINSSFSCQPSILILNSTNSSSLSQNLNISSTETNFSNLNQSSTNLSNETNSSNLNIIQTNSSTNFNQNLTNSSSAQTNSSYLNQSLINSLTETNASNINQSLTNFSLNLNQNLTNSSTETNSSYVNQSLINFFANSSNLNQSLTNYTTERNFSNSSIQFNDSANYSIQLNFSTQANLTNNSNQNFSFNEIKFNKICGALSQANSNGDCIYKSSYLSSIMTFCKSVNGISSIRVLFQYFAPLYSFYDDYWYYIYHLYPSNNSFSYLYLVELYNLNNQRIMPNFSPFNTLQSLQSFSTYANVSHFDAYCPKTILSIDGQNIYFLQIWFPMIFQNWMLSILIFLLSKLLFRFFNSILLQSSQSGIFFRIIRFFSNYFQQVSLKGMLVIAIFESNLVILSFRGTAQIFSSFSFHFLDKINIIIVNLIFFLFVIYALSFYFLISQCCKKKYYAYLDDKKKSVNSFTLQFFLLGMKNLIAGIIHFVFLDSIHVFYLLFLLKLSLIYICLRYRKFYKSQISMSFIIIYYLFGMIFDSYLIWSQPLVAIGQNISDYFYPQIIEKSCLFGFLIIVFIKILFDIGYQFKKQFFSKKNNQPKQQEEQQSKSKIKSKNQNKSVNQIAPFNNSQQMFGDAIINSTYLQDKFKPKIVQGNKATLKMSTSKKIVLKMTTNEKKLKKNQLKFIIFNSPSSVNTPSCQTLNAKHQKYLIKNKNQNLNKIQYQYPDKIQSVHPQKRIRRKINMNIQKKKLEQSVEDQDYYFQ